MTVTEYITRKNEILFKHLGLTLVPAGQIEECEQRLLSAKSDNAACPYCVVYYREDLNGYPRCKHCPMFEAGNWCLEERSTYHQAFNLKSIPRSVAQPNATWAQELRNLILQYNSDLGEPEVMYKVGARVVIRDDLVEHRWYKSAAYIPAMAEFKGQIATVQEVVPYAEVGCPGYRLEGGAHDHIWVDKMINHEATKALA